MIERIRFSDIKALLELDRLCFPPPTAFGRTTLLYYLYMADTIHYLDRDPDDQEVKAFIIASHSPVESAEPNQPPIERTGHIITLDVHPSTRRKHLATRLLDHVLGKFRAAGVDWVTLEVGVENLPAIRLYEKRGFEIIERIEKYYQTESGFEDAYGMALEMGDRKLEPAD